MDTRINAATVRGSGRPVCCGAAPMRSATFGLSGWYLAGLLAVWGLAVGETVCQYPWVSPGTCTAPTTSPANGWPGEGANPNWTALHSWDDVSNDTAGTLPHLNFVGDANNPGFYKAYFGSYVYFRMRVNYTSAAFPTGSGSGALFVLIQNTSGSTPYTPAPNWSIAWDIKNATLEGHGMEFQKLAAGGSSATPPDNRWNRTAMDDIDGNDGTKSAPDINSCPAESTNDGYIRTVTEVGGTSPLSTTAYVDFALKCSYLTWASSWVSGTSSCSNSKGTKIDPALACGGNWYIALSSSSSSNDHGPMNYDVAPLTTDVNAATPPTVPTPLTGPLATYAVVSDFDATVRNGRVVVEWDTQVEADTLGFELDRQNALGEFERVHDGLISGYGPAGEGGSYRFVDPTALPGFTYTYRLTEVDANGNRREVGQYVVTADAPQESAKYAARAMQLFPGDSTFSPRKPDAGETVRLAARRSERLDAQRQSAMTAAAAVGGAKAVNKVAVGVKEAGLYFVGAGDLDRTLGWPAGRTRTLIQARQLRLTNESKDIAWLPARNAQGIYFYGEASSSIYDPENVYVVQQGSGAAMATARVRATGPAGTPSFTSTVPAERNLFAATVRAKSPDEDYWHWAMFNASRDCTKETDSCRSHLFEIEALDPAAAGTATLAIYLRGNSSLAANPDHHLAVMLNETAIGEGWWDGLNDTTVRLTFDQSLLHTDGTNSVSVQALLDTGVDYNYFYLDRFELAYQRLYRAAGDELVASGAPNRIITTGGFSSPSISLFDLTDKTHPRSVIGPVVQGSAGNYQIGFVPASSSTPYLALTSSAVRRPASLRQMQTTGLAGRNAGAKYLVIAPEDFAESAQRLADFRANQGLSGKVVGLQAIYDDYGAGRKTPQAIRRFLLDAARYWRQPPAYVVLSGKGSFDPKDYLGYGTDRLPVLMALTEAGLIAADQRFVDRDGNGIGDTPIGRLPAATAAEFDAMVTKIIGYENATAERSRRVVLLADGPDTGGNYTADSEAMEEQLFQAGYPAEDIQKLYLEKMPVSTVRSNLLDALNKGTRLLNYFGHSGVTGLDHGLLATADAAALTNGSRLPVMAGMTCYMNRFEYPALTTLGESLLLNPQGGAVAVWSSGGTSYNSEARQLDEGLFDALFESQEDRVGNAVVSAVSRHVKAGGDASVPRVYNFLGDPATRW